MKVGRHLLIKIGEGSNMYHLTTRELNQMLNELLGEDKDKMRKYPKSRLIQLINREQARKKVEDEPEVHLEDVDDLENVEEDSEEGKESAEVETEESTETEEDTTAEPTAKKKKFRGPINGERHKAVARRLVTAMREMCAGNDDYFTPEYIANKTGLRKGTVQNYLSVWYNPERVDQPAPAKIERKREGRYVSWRFSV